MKTLYLNCGMGAAGDMLAAALFELHPDAEGALARLNAAGIAETELSLERAEKCGIWGSSFRVNVGGEEETSADCAFGAHGHSHAAEHDHDHESEHDHAVGHEHGHSHEHGHEHANEHSHDHAHRGLADMEKLISELRLPEKVKTDVKNVYALIAEAEVEVHGTSAGEIHFHELGTLDALSDISAVCLLMSELKPDRVIASPVNLGSGWVKCAHGVLPVPAPACAKLLRGIPSYGSDIEAELCTPTGAALLKYFADSFGPQPEMSTKKLGYGMGKKNFERANCVAAYIGESAAERSRDAFAEREGGLEEEIFELSCNLDDMTAEDVGFACEILLEKGALDVYTEAIGMKKGRPAVLLSCLCRDAEREKLIKLIFKHTSTLGVREKSCKRYSLRRIVEERKCGSGSFRVKRAEGFGVTREKAEYEDLSAAARREGKSLAEVRSKIKA